MKNPFLKSKKTVNLYYNSEIIKNTKEMYINNSISLSPIITENINAISTIKALDEKLLVSGSEDFNMFQKAKNLLDSRNIDPDIYLEELAKANIFIKSLKVTENMKSLDDTEKLVLEEMFIESAFASYQFQKANNLPLATFENYFTTNTGSSFHNFKELRITTTKCGKGEGFSQNGIIYLNPDMEDMFIDKYSLSTIETLTHELQHITSGNGTCKGRPLFFKREAFNEMCTEAIASKIVSQNLDDSGFKTEITFTENKSSSKETKIKSECKSYVEAAVFFDAFNEICDHKLPFIYYSKSKPFVNLPFIHIDRPVNVDNSLSQESKKFLPLMYETVDKAYHGICKDVKKFVYFEHKYPEKNFNAIIESFAKLSEEYVKSLGLNKSTTPESEEGAKVFLKVEKFFKTIDSISFQKDGENFTQAKLIKEKVLGAIYYNDKSSEEAINRLNNKRTFVKEFEENCKTATKTIEKSKTSESEITTSIENTKENETTKDNSKSDDLEL